MLGRERVRAARERRGGGTAGQAGTLRYLLADHLGSTFARVDAQGNLLGDWQQYYPYGTTHSEGSVETDKRFTGHQQEQADLYYMQARFYDPYVGRFLAPDSR